MRNRMHQKCASKRGRQCKQGCVKMALLLAILLGSQLLPSIGSVSINTGVDVCLDYRELKYLTAQGKFKKIIDIFVLRNYRMLQTT